MIIRLITNNFELNGQKFREHDVVAVKDNGVTTDMALEGALYEIENEGRKFSTQKLRTKRIGGQPYILCTREK